MLVDQIQMGLFSRLDPIIGLEKRGFAASHFQSTSGSYFKGDWPEHLVNVGINPQMRATLESRMDLTPSEWDSEYLSEIFDHELNLRLGKYKKWDVEASEGLCDLTMQFDIDSLGDLIEEGSDYTETFMMRFTETSKIAISNGLKVDILINQLAGTTSDNRDLERYNAISSYISDYFAYNNIDSSQFGIRHLQENSFDYWKLYLDEITKDGAESFRLNAEWAIYEPERDNFDETYVDELAKIIKYAKSKNIEFKLCLNHFVMPLWLKEGWLDKRSVKLFAEYGMKILDGLEQREAMPDQVVTINEPGTVIGAALYEGIWPPYKKADIGALWKAANNSAEAHILAYERIKAKYPDLPTSYSYNFGFYEARDKDDISDETIDSIIAKIPFLGRENARDLAHLGDKLWAKIVSTLNEYWVNYVFMKSLLKGRLLTDGIGGQYYNKYKVSFGSSSSIAQPHLDYDEENPDNFENGWLRYPEGLFIMHIRLNKMLLIMNLLLGRKDEPFIHVTETGVPSVTDNAKEVNILGHAISEANKLTPIKVNYLELWAEAENLEWHHGVVPFGNKKYDFSGKPQPGVEPKPLNLKDPNIYKEVKSFREVLKWYVWFTGKKEFRVELQEMEQFLIENKPGVNEP